MEFRLDDFDITEFRFRTDPSAVSVSSNAKH